MKWLGGLITLIVLFLLLFPQSAVAASCTNVSSYGQVKLSIPTLPKAGEYAIWLRIQAPVSGKQLLVQINQESCLKLTTSDREGKEWYWQEPTTDQQNNIYNFTST